jgi:PhnB protein
MYTQAPPQGYQTVSPYLPVRDLNALIAFLEHAFDGQVMERHLDAEGQPMHAEMQLGTSRIMMGQVKADAEPMPAMLYLYVDDCDVAYERGLAAGATSVKAPVDMPYGDRSGAVQDASGCQWWLASRVKVPG